MKYVRFLQDVRLKDIAIVGGKNASLGQMIAHLSPHGIRIPGGFVLTADTYWYYLRSNDLIEPIKSIMAQLINIQDMSQLKKVGFEIRSLITNGSMPADVVQEVLQAYQELSVTYGMDNCDVAVRSSATAEDLPEASFAGQQETYLNVRGEQELIESCKKCMASLFTDRAIVYRVEHGFDHFQVALSVGVQKMIRSDLACAGVAFSLDPETGFKDMVVINGSWGLGESVVKGVVTPDEFYVFKPTLVNELLDPIVKKELGDKRTKLVYTDDQESLTRTVKVSPEDYRKLSLNDAEIKELAHAVVAIECYYSQLKGHWSPMDIEWAKDGQDGQLYIVQARPETIHAPRKTGAGHDVYHLLNEGSKNILARGQSVGQQICSGSVRVIADARSIGSVQKGDIIVTTMTDPDWVPAMKCAAGIVTQDGGRTCHAAIVCRELGIPAVIGARDALRVLKTGMSVTLDCSQGSEGFVYDGVLPFEKRTIVFEALPKVPVELLINIANPDAALRASQLPVAGVGLARLEFIISNLIQIHPMALIYPERVKDQGVVDTINRLTQGYVDKKQFFIDTLAEGIALIAAAFYPRKVIIRLSDFKTNEYRNLIGGTFFEPQEENPMLGLRGASRYYHPEFQYAFALECAALSRVRDIMGLTNVMVMVPFVRTVEEAQKVVNILKSHNLARGANDLKLVMMIEIPSNVLLIDKFGAFFDGFSIGSNDLTQLTLGVDRGSQELASLFDERDEAVQLVMKMAIDGARSNNKFIGICGQAPSDYPEVAQLLIDNGITSISLNQDAVIPFLTKF